MWKKRKRKKSKKRKRRKVEERESVGVVGWGDKTFAVAIYLFRSRFHLTK